MAALITQTKICKEQQYIIGDDGQSTTTTNSLACTMYRSYGTVTALFRSLIASRMSSSRAYNNPISKE